MFYSEICCLAFFFFFAVPGFLRETRVSATEESPFGGLFTW